MRELIRKVIALISFPLVLLAIATLALTGFVMGYGYRRTFTVLCEEIRDALKAARGRILAGGKYK